MLFTPENYKLWDCWILYREGKYYLYHLSLRKELLGKSGWEGINLAISDDCVHWKEYGRVLEKSPEAEWIGTGMIQKIGDRYLMNFSEEKPKGTQRVYFAESKDLLHWKRIEGAVCQPDGVYYMDKPDDISNTIPRWDSVGIVDAMEDKGAPYYGFVTSKQKRFFGAFDKRRRLALALFAERLSGYGRVPRVRGAGACGAERQTLCAFLHVQLSRLPVRQPFRRHERRYLLRRGRQPYGALSLAGRRLYAARHPQQRKGQYGHRRQTAQGGERGLVLPYLGR